jgi:hypothetical protein
MMIHAHLHKSSTGVGVSSSSIMGQRLLRAK